MSLAKFTEHFLATFPELLGQRVLASLSGGPDSVALLHLLRRDDLALNLEAAHVHHGVRGEEANRDASFCEALCAELGVPFHLLRIDGRAPHTSGREGTWRRLRYRALLGLKQARDFNAVATGHHRDDIAEGVLVQLLRGGGPRALSGIEAATKDGIIRPLLPWSREEIRSWLDDRCIAWRQDSSNSDLELLRNRVRLDLMPGLESVSPSIRKHLVHLARTLAADEEFIAGELGRRARWIDPWDPQGGIPVVSVHAMPPPLRTRWLHAQTSRIGLERVTRRQSALFGEMIEDGHPRAVTLGGRWRLRLARGHLWLESPTVIDGFDNPITAGETLQLPIPGWQVRMGSTATPPAKVRWSWTSPSNARLRVRNVNLNDRIGIDSSGPRAAKILARKLPRHLRSIWPVFCEDDRIYWIPGVWQDQAVEDREGHVVEVMHCEQSAGHI
ncbi:MAG: tRNA lysidine(34) synthetase TilS [Acidobacteriota bacterium]|jgi:tRNA(Ile)-lysidine synthase|nr:tRNA lysidine(34) synthetase TilS [Acidobacteriota bacterium]